ncbi:MAG TPA: hypothetical protein VLM37_08330, partial [Fibrobacteraceae bacterium]|nr:hypothetical protein [Fibrobacteraceae bacterium]
SGTPEFDRILLDAPCSNLGVIPRRPEVPMRLTEDGFKQITARQKAILDGASTHLRPGGVLVYATCSPESEESLEIVEAFLRGHENFFLEDASSWVPARWVSRQCVFTSEASMGFDGFFAARLRLRET